MKRSITTAAAGILLLMANAAFAHEYKIGNLEIVHPVARATLANAPVSGGYMTIRNSGDQPDILVGASVGFAGKVEIHEMKMDGDVMKMRELESGLEIPAGGEVVLMPGGYHVMFMQLQEQLVMGEKRPGTLQFKNAGELSIEFNVEEIKPGAAMDHSKMDHSKTTN